MIDPYVFLVAHVDQAVVALESVGVNDRAKVHFTTNYGQHRRLCTVFDDLGVNLAEPLADAKTIVFLPAPRPALHLTRRGPK